MPRSNKLPSVMCMSCKFMNYEPNCSQPYNCTDSYTFQSSVKVNCFPENDGTASECKTFQPK